MRILGIDPGTAIMGWGVIEADGGEVAMIGYGALTTPAKTPLPRRQWSSERCDWVASADSPARPARAAAATKLRARRARRMT